LPSAQRGGPYHGGQGQQRQAQGRLGAGHGLPPVLLGGLIGRLRRRKWGKRKIRAGAVGRFAWLPYRDGGSECFSGSDERNDMKTDQTAPQNIDEYIAGFPHDVQEILEKIRMTIRKAAPDAEETINYQIPTFTLKGNLVHFAAFKKHIGFYPTPTGIEKFKNELSVYEGAKGSVKFPLDKPIPFALISKIVKFRVKENLARAEAKGKKK
jgi:uncharacterized protein YdhG (YjbR/CyaY superfamily)